MRIWKLGIYIVIDLTHPYGNAFYDTSTLSPNDNFDQRVSGSIFFFELAARLSTHGAANSAFEEIHRLYTWMSSHDPKITMWEGIGPDGGTYSGGFTSMAHGWSTGIVALMSNYILGVTALSPGFVNWKASPVVDGGGLTWARGVVPTPKGSLAVSWETRDQGVGRVLYFNVTAPEETHGTIYIPNVGSAHSRLTLNGEHSPNEWERTAVHVVGGSHIITVGA